jgi:hypothetical protein
MIYKMKKLLKNICTIVALSLLTVGCDKEDVNSGELAVDVMVADPGTQINKAAPNVQVRVEGSGLSSLKSLVLDNKIAVNFNPSYISDKAMIFTVPFDEAKGSRFGIQPITFTNNQGSITKDFEIIQPAPTFLRIVPSVAVPGSPLIVEGTWFYNISSVTLGGSSLPFTRLGDTKVEVVVPSNAVSGSELVITTPGGSISKVLDFSLRVLVNITDFDGGGVRESWSTYGDVGASNFAVSGGPTGLYGSVSWLGATAFNYNGSSGGGGAKFLPSVAKTASKATLFIDVNTNAANVHVAIQLNTIDGKNYGFNYKTTAAGWQTKEIKISDFKGNYGYGSDLATALDVSLIDEVKIGLAQGDTPTPSIVNFDNIKLRYIE